MKQLNDTYNVVIRLGAGAQQRLCPRHGPARDRHSVARQHALLQPLQRVSEVLPNTSIGPVHG